MRQLVWSALIWTAWSGMALAHASEQGFVLLLPTDVYIRAGVASVGLTAVMLALLPARVMVALFAPCHLWPLRRPRWHLVTSTVSAILLTGLILAGLYGDRDPLTNPMPLFIWVVWWIGLVTVQGLFFDHWRWSNPWVGPAALLHRLTGECAPLRYPRRWGYGPGIAGFLAFAGFLLADPAPADPARLAVLVGLYWLLMLVGTALFGARWLLRAEAVTILMRIYGRAAIFGRHRGRRAAGLPGWQITRRGSGGIGAGLFVLLALGSGSFDGLNETFWWLGILGLNPLEFPGRSAVVIQTLTGLIVVNAVLIPAFAGSLWLGLKAAGGEVRLTRAFAAFAPSILPIALGYHIAHYLTTFLVDGQYVIKAVSETLGGNDIRVTAGFLNTPGTVKLIWLSQAGAVVIGHVIAILVAHALALQVFGNPRRAMLSQVPLAVFMIAYTFFGLWLLASPRGF